MRNQILLFLMIINFSITYAQTGKSPYPIIFVHGFNSNDMTWATTYNYLSNSFSIGSGNKFHAVLNSHGGDTTVYYADVMNPTRNTSGVEVNRLTNSSIYLVNFQNFWNRNITDPRIITYSDVTPGSNQSSSNKSAIYKQGYALKKCIDSVLNVSGADKVILVGHSMGGLAIREYLQRLNEFGKHSWWVDSLDETNGHHVAKVVTYGTPHSGTNFGIGTTTTEAARDFRYSYTGGITAPYLFGNNEINVPGTFYNKDVNCDGDEADLIVGINNVSDYNAALPLPLNIEYTWITSNYSGSSDGVVDLSRQWIYNGSGNPSPAGRADTLLTNKFHTDETSDYKAIIRGLDEPDNMDFAYSLKLDTTYSGFITTPSSGIANSSDSDFYKINIPSNGKLTVTISGSNAGLSELSVLSNTGNVIVTTPIVNNTEVISYNVNSGDYFIRLKGIGTQNTNFNSYRLEAGFVPSDFYFNIGLSVQGLRNVIANNLKDTVTIYFKNPVSPYLTLDSAKTILDSVTSQAASVINTNNIENGIPYYIVVKHRNSIETWSSSTPVFSNEFLSYNFKSSSSQAFGNNMIAVHTVWCLFSGDSDQDGIIDGSDGLLIDNDASNFLTGYVTTDLNGDYFVDGSDAVIANNNAFNFVSVVRP
ncbi:MAG: pre-peptidase C-terminal domain-containing protein [Ignavibacteria bacterium]